MPSLVPRPARLAAFACPLTRRISIASSMSPSASSRAVLQSIIAGAGPLAERLDVGGGKRSSSPHRRGILRRRPPVGAGFAAAVACGCLGARRRGRGRPRVPARPAAGAAGAAAGGLGGGLRLGLAAASRPRRPPRPPCARAPPASSRCALLVLLARRLLLLLGAAPAPPRPARTPRRRPRSTLADGARSTSSQERIASSLPGIT